MERVSSADAAFLYMENNVVHMHVTGVMVLDPSGIAGGYRFEVLKDHFRDRLHLVPLFRRRIMTVPLGIDHPVWIDDPDFDLENHIRRHELGGSGSMADLADFVGDYASSPLDRSKPLWDMVVVEGLEGDRVAVVSKMHHVGIDGVSGTDLMAHLVDLSPESSRPVGADEPFEPDSVPSAGRLAVDAVISRARDPLRGVRSLGRTANAVGRLGRATIGEHGPSAARPFDAPRALFNQSLTPRRSTAFASVPLEDFKFVKSTFGVTVNDVFLAACTQSLRSYLLARDGLPHRPLLASVPVSVHGQSSDSSATNQVSNMFVRLPTNFEDPVEQLLSVNHETKDAKAVHGAIGADMIGDVTELTPPAIFNLASRLYSQAGLAERLAPIQNLVISNVPGPPIPLYVGGARLEAVFPLGPLIEGAGMNITVLSNMGNMDIGVIGCPDIAPDLADVADGIVDGIRVLKERAEAQIEAKPKKKAGSKKGSGGARSKR